MSAVADGLWGIFPIQFFKAAIRTEGRGSRRQHVNRATASPLQPAEYPIDDLLAYSFAAEAVGDHDRAQQREISVQYRAAITKDGSFFAAKCKKPAALVVEIVYRQTGTCQDCNERLIRTAYLNGADVSGHACPS